VIDAILHTDMTAHSTYHMTLLNQLATNAPFVVVDENSRVLLVDLMAHLCDLSNVAKPFRLSFIWCDKVTIEFFNQGRLEKSQGFPVKPNMDYENTTVAQNMIAFIDFLEDYFNVVGKVFPQLADYLQNAFENRNEWKRLMQKDGKPP